MDSAKRKAQKKAADIRYRARHAEERAEREKQRRVRDKEKISEQRRATYNARTEEWHAQQREYARLYYKRNIDSARYSSTVKMSIRRARIAGVETEIFTNDEMLKLYGTDCHICREPIDLLAPRRPGMPGWERGLHREHVMALRDGGSNTLENCRPAHGLCNLRKG